MKKGSPLHNNIERMNCDHPEFEAFNGDISHNHRSPSPAITTFTSASRLRPNSKETPAPLRLLYAEKMIKSFSSTRQSTSQMKWVSCTAATFTLRFESSPSKREHLLGSLSLLAFNVARFRDIKPTYLTHCQLRAGSPLRWWCQRPDVGN